MTKVSQYEFRLNELVNINDVSYVGKARIKSEYKNSWIVEVIPKINFPNSFLIIDKSNIIKIDPNFIFEINDIVDLKDKKFPFENFKPARVLDRYLPTSETNYFDKIQNLYRLNIYSLYWFEEFKLRKV